METGKFRYAGTRVVQKHQENPISLTCEGGNVWCVKDRLHLFTREVADVSSLEPLGGNCQHPLRQWQQQRIGGSSIANERADRRQPVVASASLIAAFSLQVIQERQYS
ncbi:MAG: hypothetical protein WCB27_14810 [Thermoguttaceae bacterium]